MELKGISKIAAIGLICALYSTKIVAQFSPSDSALYQKSINNAVGLYFASIGDQLGLYNGNQYVPYSFPFKEAGHPFFNKEGLSAGSVVYNKVLYTDIQLLYDEVGDFVVFADRFHRIKLISERVTAFTLYNNNFIRIVKDSINPTLINTGFYNLLYEGKITLLKKEIKAISEDILSTTDGIVRFIRVKKYYYIKKNNNFYQLKRKKDLFEIFKDNKKEIQQYIKTNKLSFKKDRDSLLAKVSAFYDQLTK
ncbi:MAG: hypothetical protein ACKVOW_08020 [Chitinophagaceae bacterium]